MPSRDFAKPFRILVLLLVLTPALAQGEDTQNCTEKALAALRTTLPISPNDNILASACKPWPDDKSRMLVAIAYEPAAPETGLQEFQAPFYVAMVNAETFQVISRYQSKIEGDATTDIHGMSFWLDTARYYLNKDTRAFGLRIRSFHDRCTYEGGFDNELKLFVIEGFNIRPVLQGLYLSVWNREGQSCGGEPANGDVAEVTRSVALSLSVEPTRTNDYADLLITATRVENKRTEAVKVRYNGKEYAPVPYFHYDPSRKLWQD